MNSSDDPQFTPLSPEQIAAGEDACRRFLGTDVVALLRPTPSAEQIVLIEVIDRLPWFTRPCDVVAGEARAILIAATVPGGSNDPMSEQSDAPWCAALVRMLHAPVIGSKLAREWFAALERLRRSAEVTPVCSRKVVRSDGQAEGPAMLRRVSPTALHDLSSMVPP